MNNLNQNIYEALLISEVSKVPTLFLGNAGIGKTTTIYKYATDFGYEVKLVRGTEFSPEDILGYPVNDAGKLRKLFPHWFSEITTNLEKKYILFIDELTTVPGHTQAALLNIIFNREIEGVKLPDNCLIVTAGNFTENLGPGFDMLYPLVSRFAVVNLEVSSSDVPVFLSKYSASVFIQPTYGYSAMSMQMKSVVEQSLVSTTNKLIQQKLVNLKKRKFFSIYKEGDVKGVVNFRTLNYAREVLIGSYEIFGDFDNYSTKLMIDGLLGYGTGDHKFDEINISESYINDVTKALSKMGITDVKEMDDEWENCLKNSDTRLDMFTVVVNEIISYKASESQIENFLKICVLFMHELRNEDLDKFEIYAAGLLKVLAVVHSNFSYSGVASIRLFCETIKKYLKSQAPLRPSSNLFNDLIKL